MPKVKSHSMQDMYVVKYTFSIASVCKRHQTIRSDVSFFDVSVSIFWHKSFKYLFLSIKNITQIQVHKWVWLKPHEVSQVFLVMIPCKTKATIFPSLYNIMLLAHLSRRLKWAFLIKICPLSVVIVVIVVFVVVVGIVGVNFSHFNHLLQNHWVNFNQT